MKSIVRGLVFLDDLAELVLVALVRRVRARWRALLAVAVAGGCALAWQPKPTPPAIAPAFEVLEIRALVEGQHSALVRFAGQPMKVVDVGDVLPDAAHPQLVIASIDCRGVNAVRVGEASVLRRLAREPHAHEASRLKVAAVAGDYPNFVAVVEHERETYIVQHGTRIPETGPTRITITKVRADLLEYWDHRIGERVAVALVPENQSAPTPAELVPPKVEELDLEGI